MNDCAYESVTDLIRSRVSGPKGKRLARCVQLYLWRKLRAQAKLSGESSRAWLKAGGTRQSAYRAGAANALTQASENL